MRFLKPAICRERVRRSRPGKMTSRSPSIRWSAESDRVVTEREGSRVKITLLGEQWHCHRPHPGKEAKRYQVEEARELLERLGVKP